MENNEPSFLEKITEFKDPYYLIKMIIILYIISKIVNLFNEKFLALIILNILIFYGPIEKKYPHFLFRSRMFIQQIFEGIIGVICCIIPSYEQKKLEA